VFDHIPVNRNVSRETDVFIVSRETPAGCREHPQGVVKHPQGVVKQRGLALDLIKHSGGFGFSGDSGFRSGSMRSPGLPGRLEPL